MKARFGVGAGILAAIALGVASYAIWFAQPSRASGPLYQSLVAEIRPDVPEQQLDATFASFLTPDMTLEEKAEVLEASGFDCRIEPASVLKENSILSCRRPIDGASACQGLRYYSYRTASGETIEANGESYQARRGTWGICEF